MLGISIGRTKSGKEIIINPNPREVNGLHAVFDEFSDWDKLDALLAVQCLMLKEQRQFQRDMDWYRALGAAEHRLTQQLGEAAILSMKNALGLHSAFAAREYGESLLHSHFTT